MSEQPPLTEAGYAARAEAHAAAVADGLTGLLPQELRDAGVHLSHATEGQE